MRQREFLIVLGRQFGDAVIGTGLIEAIAQSLPDAKISVLTRPFFQDIFRNSPHVAEIHLANFPMGTAVKRFDLKEAWTLLQRVVTLRRRKYTVITLSGDFRENLLGWLISPASNVGVVWPAGHPFRRLIRPGLMGLLTHAARISVDAPSGYMAMQRVAEVVGANSVAHPRIYDGRRQAITHRPVGMALGFHTSASQECRMWPGENWRRLALLAREAGFAVKVFGAPAERHRIAAELGDAVDNGVDIVTGTLQEFFTGFSEMRAVVCLDSFSIHAAHAIGVPSVMINGANMAAIWLPPGATLIDGGANLACAPCMNRPTCLTTDRPYRCIRDVSVERVWSALSSLCQVARVSSRG